MFYKYHSKSPWLKRVLFPFWAFQLSFMLAFISVFIWLRTYSGFQVTNGVILIVSAVCTVLSVTEIILFAASRLHPLTYLLLQLFKTITWFVLFVQAAVDTTRVNNEMEGEDKPGYSLGYRSEYFYLQWFAEPLVLFIAFLGALIYASITYHRHRRAKSRFLRSLQCTDLFPVGTPDNEAAVIPNNSFRVFRAPGNGMKEVAAPGPGMGVLSYPAEVKEKEKEKEAVEVTVLRELGGEWEVYELPATRSVRSSRGAKSVRSLKGVR